MEITEKIKRTLHKAAFIKKKMKQGMTLEQAIEAYKK